MAAISDILAATGHRPFPCPSGKWAYYQEWNKVLFLHWQVPLDALRTLVPRQLDIDTCDGIAYVSLVAFTMQKIRPRCLPAIAPLSDFHEVNIRTYVTHGGKPGVYFLRIEAAKPLSVLVARLLSRLPYRRAAMVRTATTYKSANPRKPTFLDTAFEVKAPCITMEPDHWLAERYCLYLQSKGRMYRYDIHHKPWQIREVELDQLNLNHSFPNLALGNQPDLVRYSDGVQVVAWGRTRI